ncbi:MAG TPA: VOC family protein [candidate division Zixibacteria bacterium]|nr:VOC family protein [candidate division Zixibacteria bacterium]
MTNSRIGTIGWLDLTVANAEAIKDFYSAVAGWRSLPVSMGDYNDYCMIPDGREEPVCGICHARGVNAEIPAQWVMYVTVADLATSIAECERRGGEVISGPRSYGAAAEYCLIRDPAGALVALYAERQGGGDQNAG